MVATQRYTTTDPVTLNTLAPGGQPVARSYRALVRLLSTISPRHAALFAEPQISERDGRIDWYGPATAEPRRLKDLPTDEADAVLADLSGMFTDIVAKAAELNASPDPQDVRRGAMLGAALRLPSPDYIYVHGHDPILTGWGSTPAGEEADVHVLSRLVEDYHRRNPQEPEPAEPEPEADGGKESILPSGNQVGSEDLQVVLEKPLSGSALLFRSALIATLVAIVLVIAYLLITNCSINVPSFLTGGAKRTIVSLCRSNAVSDGTALARYVERLEGDLQQRMDACGAGQASDGSTRRLQYTVLHDALSPPIGRMCPLVVCRPAVPLHWPDDASDECRRLDPAQLSLPTGSAGPNSCTIAHVPMLIDVPEGTRFSGSATLLVNGDRVKSFGYTAETVPQAHIEWGQREGRFVTYVVGTFAHPYPTQ